MPSLLGVGEYPCELVGSSIEVLEDGSGILTLAFQVDTLEGPRYLTVTDELEGPIEVGTEDEMFEDAE